MWVLGFGVGSRDLGLWRVGSGQISLCCKARTMGEQLIIELEELRDQMNLIGGSQHEIPFPYVGSVELVHECTLHIIPFSTPSILSVDFLRRRNSPKGNRRCCCCWSFSRLLLLPLPLLLHITTVTAVTAIYQYCLRSLLHSTFYLRPANYRPRPFT